MTTTPRPDELKAQAVPMVQGHRSAQASTASVAGLLGLAPDLLEAWVVAAGALASPAGDEGHRFETLMGAADRDDLLDRLCLALAGGLRTGMSRVGCSVTVADGQGGRTLAASAVWAGELDELQVQIGEGPTLQAGRERMLVLVSDLSADTRWPRLAQQAARHDVSSVIAMPIIVPAEPVSALTVYAPGAHAFDSAAIQLARQWADMASGLLRLAAQLSN